MTRMPALETERLLIRELTLDDLEPVHALLNAGFGEKPPEERREWLEWTTRNYVALGRLFQPPYGERGVILKTTNRLIGAVGFVPDSGPFKTLPSFGGGAEPIDRLHDAEFALFWAIAPDALRQGYATEAARAMIGYAFGVMTLRRIVARTDYDNAASVAVMRQLGMQVEKNPFPDPAWFQVVGVLENPQVHEQSG